MNTNRISLQFHRFETLDSTNTKAKELAMAGAPHGTVVTAEEQSGGKGRLGRSFFSPKGSGIYLSAVIRPEVIGLTVEDTVLVTTAASVAVARAVKTILDLDLNIKWVNDLYLNEKKVCGILAEGVIDPKTNTICALVLGVGINYREPSEGFPEELKDIAGALLPRDYQSHRDWKVLRDRLTEALAEELFALLPHLADREFLKEYKDRSMVLGKQIRVFPKGASAQHPDLSESSPLATALDISENGGLIVQYQDGSTETLTTGEISIRNV